MDMDIEEMDFVQDDLICSVCMAEFLYKEDLELHISQLHLNDLTMKRYCKLCTCIFSDIQEYALHLRNIHLSDFDCCKYCNKLFTSQKNVQEHEKKHRANVLYPKICCTYCSQVFSCKIELQKHVWKDNCDDNSVIITKDCLPILSSLICMNINLFLAASNNNFVYVCVVCGLSTMDIKEYLQHLTTNRCLSYACEECCDVYKFKNELKRHIRVHHLGVENRSLKKQCNKCKMSFKANMLKMHVKSCMVVTCVQCDLSFKSVHEYSDHRLAEHESKTISLQVCIYCQREMVGADTMEKHVQRVHGKTKHLYKYHCTDCDRLFQHPKWLFAHFFSTHKDLQPYTCTICNKKFRIRKKFSLHIKLTHKSDGFVEFDENFHVYFTDKKSTGVSKSGQNITQEMSGNDNESENIKNQNHEGELEIQNDENRSNFDKNKDLNKNRQSNLDKDVENCEISDRMSDGERNNEIVPMNTSHKVSKLIHEQNGLDTQKPKGFSKVDGSNDEKDNIGKYSDGEKINDERLSERRTKKPVKTQLKRKRNVNKREFDDNASSDDSDMPLNAIRKKMKSQKKLIRKPHSKLPSYKKKFYCLKCKRNCYTYQNYHRHLALHAKHKTKLCIKCYEKFDSVMKLNEHIKNAHSSSKLTDTLKKLLEKRKRVEEESKEVAETKIQQNAEGTQDVFAELTTSEKFRKTIKKVNIEQNTTKVTLKLVDKHKISVKKFLESFNPENNDVKITMLQTGDKTAVKRLRPLIKMSKVAMEPVEDHSNKKLRMPVKFTDDYKDKCQVSIKLASDYIAPTMRFEDTLNVSVEETSNNEYINAYEDDYGDEIENKHIPEVGQEEEVVLEGVEEPNKIVRTIKNLPLPSWHKVQVATLSNEAPYFKITQIDIDKEKSFTLNRKETEDTPPKDITLPNGKKLISSNPYAHLLDSKKIDELKNVKKRKSAYKPKLTNVAEAITRAIKNLDKSLPVKDRKKLCLNEK